MHSQLSVFPSLFVDKPVRHRINAGRTALKAQVDFFKRQFGQVASNWKADDTRVTFADFAISEKIFAALRRDFPRDDFCSEEGNPADEIMPLQERFAWILDPIDGTNNYALGMPFCGISLALLEKGVPVYGIIYDFSRDTLIQGGPGQGVYDGCHKVTVKPGAFGDHGIIGASFPLSRPLLDRYAPLLTTWRVRSLGSAALNLAYTAIGKLDGCIDHRVRVWDVAAGWALIRGAGGQFHCLGDELFPLQTFDPGGPANPFYAGSAAFCARLDELLTAADPHDPA